MRARVAVGRRGRGAAVALGVCAIVFAACSGSGPGAGSAGPTSGPSAGGGPTAEATASAGPQSTAPASFQLTVAGEANVSGTWGKSFGVSCNNPTLAGLDILFFAQSPDAKAVVLITLTASSIGVSERAGAGADYTDREFSGTGVTAFDAARGATFDSDLTIVPSPGSKPGTLGTITHVSGAIDCGNQTPGTSTIVASGSSAEGSIEGAFTAARVTCNSSAQYGLSVSTSAVISSATPPVFMIINFTPTNSTIFAITDNPSKQHSYVYDKAGTLTISATGAHADATFAEVLPAGSTATPHTIHLVGDVSCGTFATN